MCSSDLTITLCYNNPTDYVDFSMLINRFGYQHFNVTNGAISVSKLLTENFSLGLRFNYYAIDYIDKEHISSALSADIGFQYIIVDKLIIGMLITNPFFVKYNADEMNFYLPVIFEIGMNYIINDFFNALAEIEKNYRVPFAFKIGVEFLPYKELTLRAGLVTSPLMPTFGIEYMIAGFKTNISCQYHDILGFSPSVSLSYSF